MGIQHDQDMGIQHEIDGHVIANSDGQNSGNGPEDDPIFLVDGIFQDQRFTDNMSIPGLQDPPNLYDMGQDIGPTVQSHSPPRQNDGYLELNDLLDTVNVDYPSGEDSLGCVLGDCNGQMYLNQGAEGNSLPEMHETERFFETMNENTGFQTFQDDFYLEPNDLNNIFGDYPSDQAAEDNLLFYDASSNDLPIGQENFVQTNDQNLPLDGSSEFYLVDDITTYFDNADNNLHYSTLDSSEKLSLDSSASNQPNFVPEVGSSVPTHKAPHQVSEANVGASSGNWSNRINENVTEAADSQEQKGCDGTIKKRLMNYLGSYSAPPALASDCPASSGKSFGQISAINSASSVHVTAGMIQIHGFKMMGRSEHWSLPKNGEMGFLLSYGVASNVISKSGSFEPITKTHSLSLSVVLRGGLYLFFLSGMFLALCLKVGIHVCSC